MNWRVGNLVPKIMTKCFLYHDYTLLREYGQYHERKVGYNFLRNEYIASNSRFRSTISRHGHGVRQMNEIATRACHLAHFTQHNK